MRLLIADDNHDAARTLAELLRLLVPPPVEVVVAFDGRQALSAASGSHPVDVVIMDIEMPVMDGISAAVEIRHVLGSRAPTLIAATGRSDLIDGLCAGGVFDHALLKPLMLDRLLPLLRSHAQTQA